MTAPKEKMMQTECAKIEVEFFRPNQAARFLGISRRYLSHLTAIRVIPVHRLGPRCVRYRRVELIEAMNNFRQG
jgi:excisionase family DNA binding protein